MSAILVVMVVVAARQGDPQWKDAVAAMHATIGSLGLDPASTLFDLSDLIRSYARPSNLSRLHRELMLERFGASDLPANHHALRRESVVSVMIRMSSVDAATSLTIHEAATLTGRDAQEILRDVENRALWSYGHQSTLLPAWQFIVDEGSLPEMRVISDHLPTVIAAIPEESPPALVRGLMTLEDPTLSHHLGRTISPRDWLLEGHGPLPVVALLLRNLEGNDNRILAFMRGDF